MGSFAGNGTARLLPFITDHPWIAAERWYFDEYREPDEDEGFRWYSEKLPWCFTCGHANPEDHAYDWESWRAKRERDLAEMSSLRRHPEVTVESSLLHQQ